MRSLCGSFAIESQILRPNSVIFRKVILTKCRFNLSYLQPALPIAKINFEAENLQNNALFRRSAVRSIPSVYQ